MQVTEGVLRKVWVPSLSACFPFPVGSRRSFAGEGGKACSGQTPRPGVGAAQRRRFLKGAEKSNKTAGVAVRPGEGTFLSRSVLPRFHARLASLHHPRCSLHRPHRRRLHCLQRHLQKLPHRLQPRSRSSGLIQSWRTRTSWKEKGDSGQWGSQSWEELSTSRPHRALNLFSYNHQIS